MQSWRSWALSGVVGDQKMNEWFSRGVCASPCEDPGVPGTSEETSLLQKHNIEGQHCFSSNNRYPQSEPFWVLRFTQNGQRPERPTWSYYVHTTGVALWHYSCSDGGGGGVKRGGERDSGTVIYHRTFSRSGGDSGSSALSSSAWRRRWPDQFLGSTAQDSGEPSSGSQTVAF